MQEHRPHTVVTGGFGFVGCAVVEQLLAGDAQVTVIDDLTTAAVRCWDSPRVRHVARNVSEVGEALYAELAGATWIHLAAMPFVPDSFARAEAVYATNLGATLGACDLALRTRARGFVHASTAEIYASADGRLAESATIAPTSPYAHSKYAAELAVAHYARRGLRTVTLRLFNAYGSRATHPYFIPEMIRQCLTCDEIRVGDLDRWRDFTHVDDTAQALVAASRSTLAGETLNIGSGHAHRVGDILALIQRHTGAANKRVVPASDRLRPHDPVRSSACIDKAATLLNWRPTIHLDAGLARTVRAFQAGRRWPYERTPSR